MLAVIDTNVLVSGLRSNTGASYRVLELLALGRFRIAISTALYLEYADVLNRPGLIGNRSPKEIAEYIEDICALAHETPVYFRWRPFLRDAKDELIFECAVASGAEYIVTYNVSDFVGARLFGVSVVTPKDFLTILKS